MFWGKGERGRGEGIEFWYGGEEKDGYRLGGGEGKGVWGGGGEDGEGSGWVGKNSRKHHGNNGSCELGLRGVGWWTLGMGVGVVCGDLGIVGNLGVLGGGKGGRDGGGYGSVDAAGPSSGGGVGVEGKAAIEGKIFCYSFG